LECFENEISFFGVKGVSIPVAVSVFRVIHYNKLPKGGHFAAWEQPKPFVEETRTGFRSLRR
jgi:pimeloyl-ACP methyl ester carboxylesterase